MTRHPASSRWQLLGPGLGLAVVAIIAAVNLGMTVYMQVKATARPRAETARSFEPRQVHDVALILYQQPDAGDRRNFGFYQLVDHHLADGAEVLVSPGLDRHVWWLRHTGAVEARTADRPLMLDVAQSAALRSRAVQHIRLRAGTAWLVLEAGAAGEAGAPEGRVPGHVLADDAASDDVFLLPGLLYRELTGGDREAAAR